MWLLKYYPYHLIFLLFYLWTSQIQNTDPEGPATQLPVYAKKKLLHLPPSSLCFLFLFLFPVEINHNTKDKSTVQVDKSPADIAIFWIEKRRCIFLYWMFNHRNHKFLITPESANYNKHIVHQNEHVQTLSTSSTENNTLIRGATNPKSFPACTEACFEERKFKSSSAAKIDTWSSLSAQHGGCVP